MAGRALDPGVFRRQLVDVLRLEHLDLGPIVAGQTPESLPRVTLFRALDLLDLRLSFVGLTLEDTPEGRVLRRADGVRAGFLRVLLRGQHLHEEAFFEVLRSDQDPSKFVEVNTPAAASETPAVRRTSGTRPGPPTRSRRPSPSAPGSRAAPGWSSWSPTSGSPSPWRGCSPRSAPCR